MAGIFYLYHKYKESVTLLYKVFRKFKQRITKHIAVILWEAGKIGH